MLIKSTRQSVALIFLLSWWEAVLTCPVMAITTLGHKNRISRNF